MLVDLSGLEPRTAFREGRRIRQSENRDRVVLRILPKLSFAPSDFRFDGGYSFRRKEER